MTAPDSALARLAEQNRILQTVAAAVERATEMLEWANLEQVWEECPERTEEQVRKALRYLGERQIVEMQYSAVIGFEWKIRR